MSKLITFQFESQDIRFVDGHPVGVDVARILGYKDAKSAIRDLVSEKNKGVGKIPTIRYGENKPRMQEITFLLEAGIYQLIFSSKLPSAEKFQDWVFEEVLPSIRKTGGYNVKASKADISRVDARDELKDEARLDLTDQMKAHLEAIGKYDSPNTKFFFIRVHDALNKALTTETSKQMKDRIKKEFGINAEKMDLIRDFFPMKDLTNYVAVCRAWASLVKKHPNADPFEYLAEAVELGTNMKFKPTPIDFTESIKFVRHRLKEGNSQNLLT